MSKAISSRLLHRTAIAGTLAALALGVMGAAPALAMPGQRLSEAIAWLSSNPNLAGAHLGPAADLAPMLVFDTWQGGRAMPGGGALTVYLDAGDPEKDPQVRREIVVLDEKAPLSSSPAVGEAIGDVYGQSARDDFSGAASLPLASAEIPTGDSVTADDTTLDFEGGEWRQGHLFGYMVASYRGSETVSFEKPASKRHSALPAVLYRAIRRTVIIVVPSPEASLPIEFANFH